mgnify:CR=1 FL=1
MTFDDVLAPLLHSLAGNHICEDGNMDGLNALCESLKVNTTLQSIKCAVCPNLKPKCPDSNPYCEPLTPLGPTHR